jgi:predicted molibdopterin-dependent oxidoreductase YjgC
VSTEDPSSSGMSRAGQFRRLVARDSAPIPFTIDGAPAEARAGDLLLTAILLHRSSLRRFEFGDADRAGFCLMAACQDCWVSLADGRRLRACTTLVEPGMAVIIDGVGHG